MYSLKYFKAHDHEQVIAFMKANAFAVVTGYAGEFPVASHLPLEIMEDTEGIYFTGHLMRNTDHHKAFEANKNVLVIFQSPHAYIDAGWYKNPRQASTVNYMAVHAKGTISFGGEEDTIAAVKKITDKHIGPDTAASFNQLPHDYISALVKQIAAFHIRVAHIDHVFKLSQNHDIEDRQSIVTHLLERREDGDVFIAGVMKENL